MKVYLLCLDAYPETQELTQMMTSKHLTRSQLICAGAFTCATLTSMISGHIGTEIVEGGIGYNTLYKSDFYKWRRDECIVERLIQSNHTVKIHNHVPWFSKVIGGNELSKEEQSQHYRDHLVSAANDVEVHPFGVVRRGSIEYSSTNPDLSLNTFIKWNFPLLRQQFYANERDYIQYVQASKFSGLFITDLCHWHEHVYYQAGQIKSDEGITRQDALDNSIQWLENWNFDEPNSIFFIFADHSHRVEAYLDPPSYMTWVYYKDNRRDGPKTLNPVVASTDFYPLLEECFQLPSHPRIWASNPFNYNPSRRIYAVEDGRSNSLIKDKANAFGRCCIVGTHVVAVVRLNDCVNYTAGIYLTITTLTNRNTFSVYLFPPATIMCEQNVISGYSIECNDGLSLRLKKSPPIDLLTNDILRVAQELLLLLP